MISFQSLAVEQGTNFGNECLRALQYAGFVIEGVEKHIEEVGITLDAVTNNRRGVPMAWEFKGSWQGHRPGLKRTDTVKKAIANALLLSVSQYADFFPPLFLMRSHEPEGGDARRMLDVALNKGLFAAVIDSRDGEFLKQLVNAGKDDIASLVAGSACPALGKPTIVVKKKVRLDKASGGKKADAAQLSFAFST